MGPKRKAVEKKDDEVAVIGKKRKEEEVQNLTSRSTVGGLSGIPRLAGRFPHEEEDDDDSSDDEDDDETYSEEEGEDDKSDKDDEDDSDGDGDVSGRDLYKKLIHAATTGQVDDEEDEEDDSSYGSNKDSEGSDSDNSEDSSEGELVPPESAEDREPAVRNAIQIIKQAFAASYAYENGHCPHSEHTDGEWLDDLTRYFNKKGSKTSTNARAINCIIRELRMVKQKEYDWDEHFVRRMGFCDSR